METVFVRSALNYDTDQASLGSGLICAEPTMAQQQFKTETDINEIVRQFGITGQLPTDGRMASYGDFSEVVDYHTAMNAVRSAQDAFMALPAHVRERFSNDPQRFVDFCSDDRNLEEARKLGLSPDAPKPDINRPVDPPKEVL